MTNEHFSAGFNTGLRPHELQYRYLQRKVERRDDGHGAVRPSMVVAELSVVVAGDAEGAGEEAHVVPAEVPEEVGRDPDLARRLGVGFRHGLHDGGGEEVEDCGIAEHLTRLSCVYMCVEFPGESCCCEKWESLTENFSR
jgi:hypothetical protein